MELTILGCYAATPRTITNPTAQVVAIKGQLFLIDCGEGTQVQLRKQKIKFSKINHIFISHLHGDHFFGLVGLIATFMLLNRTTDLHVYGPKGIKEIVLMQLRYGNSYTGYQLYFHELTTKTPAVVYEDDKVVVTSFPVTHRVYTNGFLFREKNNARKLNMPQLEAYGIESLYYQKVKMGGDVTLENGITIPNAALSFDPQEACSYAFCADTCYDEQIANYVKGTTAIYHESTFLESELHLAERTQHSTAKQAATIAKLADVKALILGHFSTRYENLNAFKEEAQTIFEPVFLADDGRVFEITTEKGVHVLPPNAT